MLRSVLLIAASLALAAPSLAADEKGPEGVALKQHGHGWLLSDGKGMSLYTFERDDAPGKSTCVGVCAQQWPPFLVKGNDEPSADWSIISRPDGVKQWAFLGKPLYNSMRDAVPGESNGDGVDNQWHLGFKPIPTPPGIGISRTLIGYVLADQKDLTLYALEKDKDGSGCDLACSETWMPVIAAGMAHPIVDWTLVTRKDGTRQWAYKGKPVYRYAHDVHAGEALGDKVGKGWKAVVLEPPLPNPAWITFQASDAGELLADAKGRTIYTLNANRRGIANPQNTFDRPGDWQPLAAAADDKGVGNWSVIEGKDGARQWAFKGMPCFTNVNDVMPGDILGIRSGDRRLQAIMRSGQPMQGTGV